jgi:hypothetical protein
MQLRSRNITTTTIPTKPVRANKDRINLLVGHVHYKSFLSIVGLLRENSRKMEALDYSSLERIKIITTMFRLVQSKIFEICYLSKIPHYLNIKKTYMAIKDKIPQLIQSISNIMNDRIDLEDEKIEEISACLDLLMKLRKRFT